MLKMSNEKNHLKAINRRHEAVFGIVLAAILIVIAVLGKHPQDKSSEVVMLKKVPAEQDFRQTIVTANHYDSQLSESKRVLISSLETPNGTGTVESPTELIDERRLLRWIRAEDYLVAHHYLIEQAAKAVDLKDHQQLGQIMRLLAQLSASQGDLASAEVYLFEALEIFKLLNNRQDLAATNLLIGQMYARRRQIAQMAGWAYGDLLMARFFLSKGRYYQARDTLALSIQDNLKLGRTGAVASAYKTMARYYREVNDTAGEQDALIQAGKYYAQSGQSYQAEQVVVQLHQRQAPLDLIESLERQIEFSLSKYESQINIEHQARDYMQLYSLYKSKGEHGRAWQFRVKAAEILSRADKRDMYYQMPDVMAVLYDSNFNISKASDFYKQASDYYLSQNQFKAHQRAEELISNLN